MSKIIFIPMTQNILVKRLLKSNFNGEKLFSACLKQIGIVFQTTMFYIHWYKNLYFDGIELLSHKHIFVFKNNN